MMSREGKFKLFLGTNFRRLQDPAMCLGERRQASAICKERDPVRPLAATAGSCQSITQQILLS